MGFLSRKTKPRRRRSSRSRIRSSRSCRRWSGWFPSEGPTARLAGPVAEESTVPSRKLRRRRSSTTRPLESQKLPSPKAEKPVVEAEADGEPERMMARDLIAPSRHEQPQEEPADEVPGQARRRDRLRQPEGRGRQDDDDPQPRRRLRRDRPPGALHRPRPAGQPDDEPGDRPRQGREEPLRRARQRHADQRDHRQARDRHRRRLDRPGRRRDRDEHQDRPRALAREGAERGLRRLRLRLHRHAAQPRAC